MGKIKIETYEQMYYNKTNIELVIKINSKEGKNILI